VLWQLRGYPSEYDSLASRSYSDTTSSSSFTALHRRRLVPQNDMKGSFDTRVVTVWGKSKETMLHASPFWPVVNTEQTKKLSK